MQGSGELLELKPPIPEGTCYCGEEYSRGQYGVENEKANVYLEYPHGMRQHPLYYLSCPGEVIGCRILYSGVEDGLFRYNKNTIVSLRIPYSSLDRILDGATVSATHRQQAADCQALPDPYMSLTTHCSVQYDFNEKLGLPDHGCLCPICKDSPEKIIGDATRLDMQGHHFTGTPIGKQFLSDTLLPRQHDRVQRAFIDDRLTAGERGTCRRHLNEVQSSFSTKDPGASFPLEDAEKAELEGFMDAHFLLGPFLEWLVRTGPELSKPERKSVALLLRNICSESPVISYFTLAAAAAVGPELDTPPGQRFLSMEVLRLLKEEAPQLADVIMAARAHAGDVAGAFVITPHFFGLLDHLCMKTTLCASGPAALDADPNLPLPTAVTNDFVRQGNCIWLKRVRWQARFEADAAEPDSAESDCRHGSHAYNNRTGGIFTWFCEHGVCYGVQVLKDAEGRKEPFDFLSCYFKEAPKVVVYDFACALHEYCMNRLPDFFKNTRFVVDRFHWFNHRACARSYDIRAFAALNAVNTIAAEQNNAALKRIKATVTRMKQRPFMLLVRLFMASWNAKKAAKWQGVLDSRPSHQEQRDGAAIMDE